MATSVLYLRLLADKSGSMADGDLFGNMVRLAFSQLLLEIGQDQQAKGGKTVLQVDLFDSEWKPNVAHMLIEPGQAFKHQLADLQTKILSQHIPNGGTAYYTSTIMALEQMQLEAKQHHDATWTGELVLLTDGADHHSTHTKDEMAVAVNSAKEYNITVRTIMADDIAQKAMTDLQEASQSAPVTFSRSSQQESLGMAFRQVSRAVSSSGPPLSVRLRPAVTPLAATTSYMSLNGADDGDGDVLDEDGDIVLVNTQDFAALGPRGVSDSQTQPLLGRSSTIA